MSVYPTVYEIFIVE